MKSWICIKKCYYNDRLWVPDENKVLRSEKKPNKHFMEVDLDAPVDPKELAEREERGTDPFNLIKNQIKDVLIKLDTKDDAAWSTNGKPLMVVVNALLGFDVTRKQLEDSFPGFNRESDIKTISSHKQTLKD